MNFIPSQLPGVIIIEPDIFGDERGFFMETWRAAHYAEHGIPEQFVQDNLSLSQQGVLRGLHYQHPDAQGKLITVLQGEVYDVAVDIRVGSPTFGQWMGITLSGENKNQVYVPPGFAHGFSVTSDSALFMYKCTRIYNPNTEFSIAWNDPDIGIEWPSASPQLADKDQQAPFLKDISETQLPKYQAEPGS